MARIRTIKPDFWTNEKVMSCNPLTRLLFIGMWNFADDYGRLLFAPMSIKAKVFPNDSLSANDVRDMLNELCSNDLLTIYSALDKEYIEITGWDHQRIDKRQVSKIPGPFDDVSSIRGLPPTSADLPRTPPTPAPVMEGKGRECSGREGKEDTREVALADDWPSSCVDDFWALWPNKVGKPAAVKALASARRRRASFAEIMFGVGEYIRDKPPDRPWLNPATFLNQNRWEDQPAPTVIAISAKPLTEFQRKQQETNDVTAHLRSFANGLGSGSNPDRLLSDHHGERPEDLRSGSGSNIVALPGASGRGSP